MRQTRTTPLQLYFAILSAVAAAICFCCNIIPRGSIYLPHAGFLLFPLLLYPAYIIDSTWRSWRLRLHTTKARRRGLILCSTCGYDLRATPDRCPECGHT